MTPLCNKLKLSYNLDEILILNEPEGFSIALEKLPNLTIKESLVQVSRVDFAIVFINDDTKIENQIETLYPKLIGDAILWFAYPNETPLRFKLDTSTFYNWQILEDYNLIPVKKIVMNSDWLAIRFRKIDYTNAYIRLKQKFNSYKKFKQNKKSKTT
ncbi:hypothetical protein ACE939_09575 [Aquimarina sp. W85]|uniref:hypothetical protein n=1 Tax=Aquimarina rhodophyticola TaxID=3342246 RepID=UPI00366D13BB